MKNRISKILGVAVTLAMVLSMAAAFSAPAAASPDETLNEWYKFDKFPAQGADGDWFYDPSIMANREITKAIDDTLYVNVQRILDADPTDEDYDDFYFDNADGTLTITEFDDTDTGLITADIDGDWDGPEKDFVACLHVTGAFTDTVCIHGTITATNLTFEGSIEDLGGFIPEDEWHVTDGYFSVSADGFNVYNGRFEIVDGGPTHIHFSGDTNIGSAIFKSTDGGRTWEDTDFPGGTVMDMAPSSLDADILYVTDGHYVYMTDDAGDSWEYLAKDSLEEVLMGYCGVPPACCTCGDEDCELCPFCYDYWSVEFSCPITSIDVGYDDDENPFVFIGTRQHCSGLDLDGDDHFDSFPGDVYYIGKPGLGVAWTALGLSCLGYYDVLAVGCQPNFADEAKTFAVVSDDSETHVVYTTGGPCGFEEFAELLWDCETSFDSIFASRIGFPDDWEDEETLFVGVVDCDYCDECADECTPPCGGPGGDVYSVAEGDAYDLNIAGTIGGGCDGKYPVDIISLDVKGDTGDADLIAGAWCCNEVWYSTDGGVEWDADKKEPTGESMTYVIWYKDTALAATFGDECAVSMSCGEEVGQYWNQISLIATDIDKVWYIDHSPGYLCGGSSTLFMLTNWENEFCINCLECERECYFGSDSLWRYDGEYWERVFTNFISGSDEDVEALRRVRVSPDFNETNTVFVTNRSFEMWRSQDAGCSWTKLKFPCPPRPCIGAAIVIDEETIIAGGCSYGPDCDDAEGYVYKTTNHGNKKWSKYELPAGAGCANHFALQPGFADIDPGELNVLLGDDISQVFISLDGGETWDLVGEPGEDLDCEPGDADRDECPTWVAFDPDYAINNTIYAATGEIVARCIIDFAEAWEDQEWEVLCDELDVAAGIGVVGDTALYVTDSDTVGISDCDGGTDYAVEGGVIRSLNPTEEDAEDVIFERIGPGLEDDKTALRNLWITCDTSDDGCAENVLWSLEQYHAHPENIWIYEDTLAAPVTLVSPAPGQHLTTKYEATLSWNELCDADCYEVSLYAYCPECPDEKLTVSLELDCAPEDCGIACAPSAAIEPCACVVGECPCTTDTCIVVSADTTGEPLEPGTTYYWKVRVCQGKPTLSKWSEERTFTTALLAVPFEDLCSPACGSQDIILKPNFAWGAVDGATGYEVQLAPTETFTAGVIKGTTTVNAWVCPETLEYSTTYYWKVRAAKDGIYSDWTVCMFTTMPKPVPPTPPVEVTVPPAAPAPQLVIPPAQMITPTWIYAIIGVGGALAIVVIVLIVRTRRPPA